MSKYIILFSIVLMVNINTFLSQTTVFSEDFEGVSCNEIHSSFFNFGYIPSGWDEYDEDNNSYVGSSSFGTYMNSYGARVIRYNNLSNQNALFYAYHGAATPTEDWLVTPQILLPSSGSCELKFHGIGDWAYNFKVYITTGGNSPVSFLGNPVCVINQNYADTNVTVNLNSYIGQAIYIGFEFTTSSSSSSSKFDLDDVEVISTNSSSVAENKQIDFNVFPNPTSDYVYVSGDIKESLTIKVFDIKGTELIRSKATEKNKSINLSRLSSGLYFVEVNGVRKKVFVSK